MFRKWLNENKIEDYDFGGCLNRIKISFDCKKEKQINITLRKV